MPGGSTQWVAENATVIDSLEHFSEGVVALALQYGFPIERFRFLCLRRGRSQRRVSSRMRRVNVVVHGPGDAARRQERGLMDRRISTSGTTGNREV